MSSQKTPKISIIAALGKDTFAIGKGNKLLWHIPEDLKHFKKITGNFPLVMGRKTFESIGNRPLKGFSPTSRRNFIITRNKAFEATGCVVCNSLEEAVTKASKLYRGSEQVFVIGGAELYRQAFPFVSTLYLTFVDDPKEGDAYFPHFDEACLIRKPKIIGGPSAYKGIRYVFMQLEKKAEEFPFEKSGVQHFLRPEFGNSIFKKESR